MRRTYLALVALALLGLLVIAGCGGGGSGSSSGGGGEAETASARGGYGYGAGESSPTGPSEGEGEGAGAAGGAAAAAVVKVMNTPALAQVIVDAKGMTLYDFRKDKGTTSACYGACAVAWPPLLTDGEPKALGGADGSLLGTTKRKDGTLQVTYHGHPLYGFVEDRKPGETNGNDFEGFGAKWYALEPDGEEPEQG